MYTPFGFFLQKKNKNARNLIQRSVEELGAARDENLLAFDHIWPQEKDRAINIK